MNIPNWAIIVVYAILGTIVFFLFVLALLNVLLHLMHDEIIQSRRRVSPMQQQIRREQIVIEMVERINRYKQDQAVEQVKNSVLLINPNETIQIGLPKKKP